MRRTIEPNRGYDCLVLEDCVGFYLPEFHDMGLAGWKRPLAGEGQRQTVVRRKILSLSPFSGVISARTATALSPPSVIVLGRLEACDRVGSRGLLKLRRGAVKSMKSFASANLCAGRILTRE